MGQAIAKAAKKAWNYVKGKWEDLKNWVKRNPGKVRGKENSHNIHEFALFSLGFKKQISKIVSQQQ